MAKKRALHVTKANAQNGARKEFWPAYRKLTVTRARFIGGPFTVETSAGTVDMPDGGFLALDEEGYPYPISVDIMKQTYRRVD